MKCENMKAHLRINLGKFQMQKINIPLDSCLFPFCVSSNNDKHALHQLLPSRRIFPCLPDMQKTMADLSESHLLVIQQCVVFHGDKLLSDALFALKDIQLFLLGNEDPKYKAY